MNNHGILARLSNELKLKCYSRKTIDSYCYSCGKFFEFLRKKSYNPLIWAVKRYLLKLIEKKKEVATLRLNLKKEKKVC